MTKDNVLALFRSESAVFFEADDGRKYPTSRVRSIQRDWENRKVILELDGDTVSAPEHIWDGHLRRQIVSFVPAAAGYTVLTKVGYDDGEKYDREPVVGWALNSLGELLPVTVDGLAEAGAGVLTPNGMVIEPEMGSYDSLSYYLEATGVPLSDRIA